jgi:hypothetical protein
LHPYGIVIIDYQSKHSVNYSKLIEICDRETDDGDTDDTYNIVVIISEGENKAPNTNKNLQLLFVNTDLKKFTTKDKKTIEYFTC